MRVLVCPDKFKGSLDATKAARAIARGWLRARPADAVEWLPISDGGDGFGRLLGKLLECKTRKTRTEDAAHRSCVTTWWWQPAESLAIVESAQTIGLAMLPTGRYHPFELDTFGLGAVIRAARKQRPTDMLVGIGGSATNDGGFGLARALGWQFFDGQTKSIEHWTGLHRLRQISPPDNEPAESGSQIIVAVDVTNPLLGPSGASRVYGPQKGLRREDFNQAERCLGKLAEVVRRHLRREIAAEPGAGAAGGLGFGLVAFLGAKLQPGFDLFAKYAGLDTRLRSADLVITGEGRIDASSLMGKGVGILASRCARLGLPCIGIAGALGDDLPYAKPFVQLHGLTSLTSPAQAMAEPAFWLERVAGNAARTVAGLAPVWTKDNNKNSRGGPD